MSEESETPESEAESANASADPAALTLALGAAGRAEANAFLKKQGRVAELLAEKLEREEPFERSHLRWRRFDDQMKGAMRIMLVAVGALAIAILATAMWNAGHADGLVVEAFSVPSSLAATGLAGDTISEDVTEQVNAIRQYTDAHSLGSSHSVRQDSRDEVKVEIPETGVSLTQVWRYLKSWLGNERHLRGSLRPAGDGRIALAVALDGEVPASFAGPAGDLEKLEQQAAEHVYARVEPVNYVVYLYGKNRPDEVPAAAAHMVDAAQTPEDRAQYYGVWADFTPRISGDFALADMQARIAMTGAPKAFIGYLAALRADVVLSHQEEQFRRASAILPLKEQDQPSPTQGRGWPHILSEAQSRRDELLGDYPAYAKDCKDCPFAVGLLRNAFAAALTHDPAQSRDLIAQALAARGASAQDLASARYRADMAAQDWHAAVRDAGAYVAAVDTEATIDPGYKAPLKMNAGRPWLAEATARAGDIPGAEALIVPTPRDCDACVRARGRIAALKHDWAGAAHWFEMVSARSPDIPFADADWGAMLLAHGDAAGAVAKFSAANRKGPHFADPLEGWGEALMAKNQSHLALAKFAEAEKYAPNWGRLHLKWGMALVYAGKRDEARTQFARAAQLGLSPAEKSELARHS